MVKFNSAKNALSGLLFSQLLNVSFKRLLYTVYLRPILTYAAPAWAILSNISSHQIEKLRIAERKLIRCTYNIFRARNSYKYHSNQHVYNTYNYERIDVYIAKLSYKFHERNCLSNNPLIKSLTTSYLTAGLKIVPLRELTIFSISIIITNYLIMLTK